MDKPKFTPGDWVVGLRKAQVVVEGGCSETIAVLPLAQRDGFGLVHSDEVSSNAHMIAAAPDMYAALQALDESWTKDFPEGPDGACRVLGGILSEPTRTIWRNARAALSKANGEGQE